MPRLILLGLAALMLGLTLRGLATGGMKRAGIVRRRDEAPRDYWFEIVSTLAVAVPVAILVLLLPPRSDGRDSDLFLCLLPLLMAQGLAQALWYGRAPFFFRSYSRAETPRAYRAVVAFEILFVIAFLALAAVMRGSGR